MAGLTVGIVGCGKQAEKHISGYRACEGVEIVVADIDRARACALAEATGAAMVDDPAALLSGAATDAVSLCTPTRLHAPQILAAAGSGKHYFCEKPLCETAAQAAALLAATRASGVVGQVGYIYRHVPVFREIRSILGAHGDAASPVLGPLVSATMRMGGRGSAAAWKHRRESGGGALSEMLVHMMDLAIWFFGPMEAVELLDSRLLRTSRRIGGATVECDADDFVIARLRSAGGVEIMIQADMVTPAFSQRVEIQGENGTAVGSIDSATPSFVYCVDTAGGYAGGRRTPIAYAPQNLYPDQMASFVRRIAGGGSDTDDTVRDSVEVARCLEALSA